jgi:hypothetical protein
VNEHAVAVLSERNSEFNATNAMYKMVIIHFLVEIWQETLPVTSVNNNPEYHDSSCHKTNKLDAFNIKLCENFATFLVQKLGGQLRFIRMISSLDEQDRYRLSPGGKLSITQATLFSYAVQFLGLNQSEQSMTTVVNISKELSKCKIFHLVLINLSVLAELAVDFFDEHDETSEHPKHMTCLIRLMRLRLKFLCQKYGLNEICDKLLNSDLKKSYSVYNSAPQLHDTA